MSTSITIPTNTEQPSPGSPSKTKKTHQQVQWNPGFRIMNVVAVVFASCLLWQVLNELVNGKDLMVKSTNMVGPLYTALGMFSNIAMACAFGKPYTAACLSIVGFIGSWIVSIWRPGFWEVGERMVACLIPIAMGLQYGWIGLVEKRRVYV